MPPTTRSRGTKQTTSSPSTHPKAKPKPKAKPGPKAQPKPKAKPKTKTQPKKKNVGRVPETQSEKQSIPEDLLEVQPLRNYGLSILRESNAKTLVGHLPVELLSAIFIEAAAAEYEADKTTRTRIYISCVSHHWRTVALSTPALWRRLVLRDYGDIPGIRGSMARSKKLALDLDLLAPPWYEEEDEKLHREPYRWGNEDAKVLLDQLSRARSLHVDASPETSGGLDWPKVSKSLRHLRLNDTNYIDEMPRYHRHEFDQRRYTPLTLLRQLKTRFPNLQSLDTTDHGVSLGDLRLPSSLVELSISNSQAFRRNEDATRILDVLRDLPALKQLTLTNATTMLDANAFQHSRLVSLPRLKTFSFEGQISTCLAFVRALELPRSARREITVTNESGTDEEMIHLGNDLIAELAMWETRFGSAILHNAWGLKWMAWKQPQSVEDLEEVASSAVEGIDPPKNEHGSVSPADLQIHFEANTKTLRYESLFAHVKTMVIHFHQNSSLHVPSAFTHFDKLEVMSCVFKACTQSHKDQYCFAKLNEWNPPLPRLRALRLVQFAFVKNNYDPLLDLCQKRQQMGKTLDVHLLSCYEVSKSHLAKLRAVNSSVTWDGKKTHYGNRW